MKPFRWFDFVKIDPSRHTHRSSSYSREGDNRDRIRLQKGDIATLLDVNSPGVITHIWMTADSIEQNYLRKVLLRIYWDGEAEPSVLVPLGDFFGIGHGQTATYTSLPMVMAPYEGKGLNCYLPMPFHKSARMEVISDVTGSDVRLYYNIDYETWDNPLPQDFGTFHACWRRENPTDGIIQPPEMTEDIFQHDGINLSDAGNYLLLEAEGAGQYIGCSLNIHTLRDPKDFNWYGEGDEMMFIDDDNEGKRWPPTLHGTGTEDYFNTAWGTDEAFSSPFFGLPKPGGEHYTGFISWYRWHLPDPVRFNRSIRISIEHGHANRRSDDYSSVAYWYQEEPHKPFGILPMLKRIPRADFPEIPKKPQQG